MKDKPTLDSNVLVYAFGKQDDKRKLIAKEVILQCNIISLQAINETIHILHKKFNFPLVELSAIANFMSKKFVISGLNYYTLDHTLKIATKYGFSFWDSMMVSSALDNKCTILYTEDLQHNQVIESKLRIINPFR